MGRSTEQRLVHADDGQQGCHRRGVCRRQARRHAQAQQHPHHCELDRAARRDRAISSRRRQLHALFDVAEPARHPLVGCRPGAENPRDKTARHLARCRRRLWHEARRLSRRRAGGVGVAPCRRPAGEMGVDAVGSAPWRFARPRSGRHRRIGPRRARQSFGAARQCAARHGLARVRRLDGGAAIRHAAGARRLSGPGGALRRQGGVHQHHSAFALSRRRTAGGDLPDRAIARPRRERHRHRSDRDQAAQFHSVIRHAAQDPDRHHL